MGTLPDTMTKQQFDQLFEKVSNWGVWGPEDERGTLNYITPQTIHRAASLVTTGRSVSMAIPINKVAGPDNPRAVAHFMSMLFEVDKSFGEPGFSLDYSAARFTATATRTSTHFVTLPTRESCITAGRLRW